MKNAVIDEGLKVIERYAVKGQRGAKTNTMRKIREKVRELQSLRGTKRLYKSIRFILGKDWLSKK